MTMLTFSFQIKNVIYISSNRVMNPSRFKYVVDMVSIHHSKKRHPPGNPGAIEWVSPVHPPLKIVPHISKRNGRIIKTRYDQNQNATLISRTDIHCCTVISHSYNQVQPVGEPAVCDCLAHRLIYPFSICVIDIRGIGLAILDTAHIHKLRFYLWRYKHNNLCLWKIRYKSGNLILIWSLFPAWIL